MIQNAEILLDKKNMLLKGGDFKFDLDQTLSEAMDCFYCNGYHATSVQSLTDAMGVSENELVAAFGNKHALFETVLASYSYAIINEIVGRLDEAANPLDEIRSIIRDVVKLTLDDTNHRGCMVTNSAIEFGGKDQVIIEAVNRTFMSIEDGFCRALLRAHEAGLLVADKDARSLARFLVSTIQGIRVIGRTTTDANVLRDIAETAIRCLE